MYAVREPDEATGVVLVDSSHPEQFARLPEGREQYERTKRLFAVALLLTRLGVVRLFDLNPTPPTYRPSSARGLRPWAPRRGKWVAPPKNSAPPPATPETTAQVRSTDGLGGKPLAVVSAGEQPPGWLELQDGLAASSLNSSHRVVDGATYVSLWDERRGAQVCS